ncbi:hypothetical protein ACFQS2_04715 [Brachybacterium sp. GCM10030267]|uniref:hypothetical protein n=1 Tax=unclassified Brachybacterium TaxID=2623841 RepID=UPI003607AFB1
MAENTSRSRRRQLQVAAVLLLVQGVLMEASAALGLLALLALRIPPEVITERTEIFALAYLQDNLYSMMALSGVFAALRIIGGIALLRNRLWGLVLSLVNCAVTLVLTVLLLPVGIADGVLSGAALVLILRGWLGTDEAGAPRRIVP